MGPTTCAQRIKELRHLVPAPDGDRLREEMEVAIAIFELRNGVVHGFWDASLDGVPLQRISTARVNRTTGEWIPTEFDRDYLVGAGDRALRIWGFIQSRSGRWPDVRDDGEW